MSLLLHDSFANIVLLPDPVVLTVSGTTAAAANSLLLPSPVTIVIGTTTPLNVTNGALVKPSAVLINVRTITPAIFAGAAISPDPVQIAVLAPDPDVANGTALSPTPATIAVTAPDVSTLQTVNPLATRICVRAEKMQTADFDVSAQATFQHYVSYVADLENSTTVLRVPLVSANGRMRRPEVDAQGDVTTAIVQNELSVSVPLDADLLSAISAVLADPPVTCRLTRRVHFTDGVTEIGKTSFVWMTLPVDTFTRNRGVQNHTMTLNCLGQAALAKGSTTHDATTLAFQESVANGKTTLTMAVNPFIFPEDKVNTGYDLITIRELSFSISESDSSMTLTSE